MGKSSSSSNNKNKNAKLDSETEEEKTKKAQQQQATGRALGIVVAVVAILVALFQGYIFVTSPTTFGDARIAPLHNALRALNVTSTVSGRVVPVESVVTLVSGPEGTGESAVLGVQHRVKQGDVLLAYPLGSFADASLLNTTFVHAVSQLKIFDEEKTWPRTIFALGAWLLAERRKGADSPWSEWFRAIDMSNDDGGAFFFPEEYGGCVAKFFGADFNETRGMVAKFQKAVAAICDDDDIREDFPAAHARVCGSSGGSGGSELSDAEARRTMDTVVRRGMMNQAMVPALDFAASTMAPNIGLRLNRETAQLEFVAQRTLERGAPVTFQRNLGRIDSLLRTGHVNTLLHLEAITGKLMGEDAATQKMCNQRAGLMNFGPNGEMDRALPECIALFAANGKKQRKRVIKNAAAEIAKNATLRLNVAGNISAITQQRVDLLREFDQRAEANPELKKACAPLEEFRRESIAIYEKAIAALAKIIKKNEK